MSTLGLHAHQPPTGDHLHGVTEYAPALTPEWLISVLSTTQDRRRPKEPLDTHTRIEVARPGGARSQLITRPPSAFDCGVLDAVIEASLHLGRYRVPLIGTSGDPIECG